MSNLIKKIHNGYMLKNTGSWLYCDKCNNTVGYLCYSTYQSFHLDFLCHCGNSGVFHLTYNTDPKITDSPIKLKKNKNRLCCPNDNAPLFTIVEKHIKDFSYSVCCNKCYTRFSR